MVDSSHLQLRRFVSSAISVLEIAEDNVTSASRQLVLLDAIESLRGLRVALDVARLRESDYELDAKRLGDAVRHLRKLDAELQEDISSAEKVVKNLGIVKKVLDLLDKS